MCVEAVPESLDFLFNGCDLKILSEDYIRHVPWCIDYHAQDWCKINLYHYSYTYVFPTQLEGSR
jgi:hypothetical protein